MPRFPDAPKKMHVPADFLKSVAFIGAKSPIAGGGSFLDFRGTVFFISEPISERSRGLKIIFAVTARHVIEGIEKKGMDATTYLRLNKLDGTTGEGAIKVSDWVFHEDPRVDVAVAVFYFDSRQYDLYTVDKAMFVDERMIEQTQIGPSSDIFFPGLFTRHVGASANIPLLRAGNIAAMPVEPVETEAGMADVYIIEARSIGGLSGSPVFVRMGPFRPRDLSGSEPDFFTFGLLGLIHGHWGTKDIPDANDDLLVEDALLRKSVHMGLSAVVPAKYIRETLDQSILREAKDGARNRIDELEREWLPEPDDREPA